MNGEKESRGTKLNNDDDDDDDDEDDNYYDYDDRLH